MKDDDILALAKIYLDCDELNRKNGCNANLGAFFTFNKAYENLRKSISDEVLDPKLSKCIKDIRSEYVPKKGKEITTLDEIIEKHSSTLKPGILGPFEDNQYFAFVESSELIDWDALDNTDDIPKEYRQILDIRKELIMSPPRRSFWLDCIKADYFDSLDWRNDVCRINNEEDLEERRKKIKDLVSSNFLVALLLIGDDNEDEFADTLGLEESEWHIIKLDSYKANSGGLLDGFFYDHFKHNIHTSYLWLHQIHRILNVIFYLAFSFAFIRLVLLLIVEVDIPLT